MLARNSSHKEKHESMTMLSQWYDRNKYRRIYRITTTGTISRHLGWSVRWRPYKIIILKCGTVCCSVYLLESTLKQLRQGSTLNGRGTRYDFWVARTSAKGEISDSSGRVPRTLLKLSQKWEVRLSSRSSRFATYLVKLSTKPINEELLEYRSIEQSM